LSPRAERARFMLGGCQLLLTAAIAWAAYVVGEVLPFRQIELGPSSSPWLLFGRELLHCLLAILPAASLWGASFPLALAAIAVSQGDPARPVAKIYAANTIGAIVGTVATSLWLIPSIGTQRAQQLLVGLSAVAACLAATPLALSPGRTARSLDDAKRVTSRFV